ncbi:OmpA family protein [Nocardiopsis sp. CA-288880]|uniref:OmpA family protein n=1 Tax=Nocardiopsis sp. CA-288880 TaxID=3239995 RepID=UPI003D95B412
MLILTSACVVDSGNGEPTGNASEGAAGIENPAPEAENPSEQEIIASTITSSTDIGHQLQIDVYALEKVGNGLLRLRLGITNNSGSNFRISQGLSDENNPYTANRVTLIDSANQTRHLSFDQSSGDCFCLPFDGPIGSGETVATWVVFPEPPPGIEAMTITTPLTPPLLDVPITDSSEVIENDGLSDPQIIPLTMISDNTEDQTGRTESGDEVSIILSSDVLFETNSADLSSDAQEILEQVATEINDASSSVVNIDGHADNTGSDAVNIPLSQERAEAVETALSEQINRDGVTFEVQGHGSNDPIAENDTEEGQERNRRVSVTFEK